MLAPKSHKYLILCTNPLQIGILEVIQITVIIFTLKQEAKHPVILPKDSHVTRFILREFNDLCYLSRIMLEKVAAKKLCGIFFLSAAIVHLQVKNIREGVRIY